MNKQPATIEEKRWLRAIHYEFIIFFVIWMKEIITAVHYDVSGKHECDFNTEFILILFRSSLPARSSGAI